MLASRKDRGSEITDNSSPVQPRIGAAGQNQRLPKSALPSEAETSVRHRLVLLRRENAKFLWTVCSESLRKGAEEELYRIESNKSVKMAV